MAGRLPKVKLDYFPLYCNMGDKVKYLEARCGLIGFAILIKLLQKIYGERGYYCEFNEKKAFLLADELKTGERKIIQTVEVSVSEGIFEEEMYRKYGILTSARIQENFLDATSRRVDAKILPEYALVNCAQILEDECKNAIYDNKNEENALTNEQREKEVKDKDKFHFSSFVTGGDILKDERLKLSDGEIASIRKNISAEDLRHYCEVVISSEAKGHSYTKKTHFEAIMEMAKKDGKLINCTPSAKGTPRAVPKYGNFDINEAFAAALERSYEG